MASTTQTINIKNQPIYIEYRNQLVGGTVLITAALAFLAFALKIEALVPVLQFWLVFLVVGIMVTTLSSQTVRQARRWHGVDWWLAVLSAMLLSFFLIIGIIPEYLAPYDYNEEVGPGFLAPREVPESYLLITRTDLPFESFADIGKDISTGEVIERASQAYAVGSIDEQGGNIIREERDRQGILIDRGRFADDAIPEDALDALSTSDITGRRPLVAVVGRESEFADLVSEYGNLRVIGPIGPTYKSGFLLGTNNLGEDLFSRLIYGTRTTLLISITAALFSSLIGIPLGLMSGYIGGFLDRTLTPLMDSIYSFPALILAIAIAAAFGRGVETVIGAIGVVYIPTYYRIVRSQTLAVKEEAFVEAAKSLGANNFIILWRYVFPNVFASVVVIFSINIADAILTGAALAFLSLGLPETIPDWGVDLVKGQQYFLSGEWWLVTFPGLCIAILTLCFSMLGESLSEILNPRLNRQ
jgi:peptide/nickel transport system permease protein